MKSEGTFNRVFYDGSVKDDKDFVRFMRRESAIPVIAFDRTEPVLFAWLNDLRSNYAFCHFGALHPWGKTALDVARMILRYWGGILPELKVILGLIPKENRLAIRFGKNLGFKELGTIPHLIGAGATLLYYEV